MSVLLGQFSLAIDPFFYTVIAAGAIAGASCGLLGAYIVALRLPFIGVFISHTAMAGTIFAYLFGLNPTVGPVVVSTIAAMSLAGIRPGRSRLDPNVALGILFSLMLGLTFLGIGLTQDSRTEILGLLWGSILFVRGESVVVIGVAALAMIVIMSGLVWGLLGTAALKRMAFPLLFLIFMVPLPFVEPLSVPMAQVTGVISAGIVRLFGVPVEVSGAQVSLPNAELVVGAQCSGLRSIVTLLTLVGLIVFVLEGALWRKVVLALSSIVIAAFGNVLRVASLLGVANLWGADAAFKYYHDYSGIVFFASAFVLLLLFSRLMGCREIKEGLF